MPQVTLIIPCEVQTSDTHKCTNSLQRNSKRKECQIENVDSQDGFRQRNWESKP
jgi:hypothetical protein